MIVHTQLENRDVQFMLQLARAGGMVTQIHETPPEKTFVWWGAMVDVQPGDVVRLFRSPIGLCVEQVFTADGRVKEVRQLMPGFKGVWGVSVV